MPSLSASQLLGVWEQGTSRAPAERALLLLSAACPELAVDELARLSVGRRDERLLALREGMFSSQLTAVADCAACGEQLEMAFDVADMRVATPHAPAEQLTVEADGYVVRVRLPNSLDLLDSTGVGPEGIPQALLGRCVLEATCRGETIAVTALPDDIRDLIGERMAAADPQAEVELDLSCPACGQAWRAPFDIVSYLWSEIETWAHRTLTDVHVLAAAYGWSEAEILALGPRRQWYLEAAGG